MAKMQMIEIMYVNTQQPLINIISWCGHGRFEHGCLRYSAHLFVKSWLCPYEGRGFKPG